MGWSQLNENYEHLKTGNTATRVHRWENRGTTETRLPPHYSLETSTSIVWRLFLNYKKPEDFPGGQVVKTLRFPTQGAQVQSLFGKLKSHMQYMQPKKNYEKTN